MVGALEENGAIKEVADAIADVTNGDRTAELMGIMWVSAIGSGIIDNIPFTATMIPVVEQLQGGAGEDDAYWWALVAGGLLRRQRPPIRVISTGATLQLLDDGDHRGGEGCCR